MPLENTPTDNALRTVVAQYERQIGGRSLSMAELNRIAESAKRLVLDEVQSLKAAG
ncbi:MAG: hypothetical protein WD645_06065 [Dehalococcoidia bacterium]